MRKTLNNPLLGTVVIVLAALGLARAATAETRRLRSPLEITVKMEKDLYREYEDVDGEVVIFNSRPATYPVNFTVILTRNGEFYRRSVVNAPVFSGRNELGLDTFAKDVFTGPHAVAHWQMEISTGGDHPVTATAQWRIVSADYQEKPEKRSKYLYSTSPDDRPATRKKKRAMDFRDTPRTFGHPDFGRQE